MMNAQLYSLKITSLFISLTASLSLLSCGSFQGASYFSSDGIYTNNVQTSSERSAVATNNNGDYYSNYFKDAAQENLAENEMYFTDTENYTSKEPYTDENTYVESSQIPWGEKTSQTEIIIVDRSPNYLWGLSSFAFRASPFWNNFYNDPFRFGYGVYSTPFINPSMNPYFGGYSGYWGYDPFLSPFSYFPAYGYGYRWNMWNRWNRWGQYGTDYYGYNGSKGYGKNYNSTVARIKSGRGEKNYEGSRRSNISQERNAKNNIGSNTDKQNNRINSGRGLNSLRTTYLLTNRVNNTLDAKTIGKSITARPVFGSAPSASSLNSINRANINLSKGVKSVLSSGRFTQSRYRSLGERQTPKTTSPRKSVNKSTTPKGGSTSADYGSQNSRRTNSNSKATSRNYENHTSRSNNHSKPSYRSTAPSRSYNSTRSSRSFSSGGSSRSSNSGGGRSSGGGRRN
jgi:hypothetical protein